MHSVKSVLESFKTMSPKTKVFYLALVGKTDLESKFLGAIIDPKEVCDNNFLGMEEIMRSFEEPFSKESSNYSLLHAPNIDTYKIATTIFDTVKIPGSTTDKIVDYLIFPKNSFSSFTFSLPLSNQPTVLEISTLLNEASKLEFS